jgi:hypothetical protein
VSVDLVAASHLKLKDWSLAVALYKAVADEMRQSNEMKRALADDMEKRAHVVCNTIPLTIIIIIITTTTTTTTTTIIIIIIME